MGAVVRASPRYGIKTTMKLTGTGGQKGGQDHVLSQADALTKKVIKKKVYKICNIRQHQETHDELPTTRLDMVRAPPV